MERFIERFVSDRRLARRHQLKTPLRVRIRRLNDAERDVESENLSKRGVFFATDLPLSKGASLDLLLEMPEAVTGMPPAQWLCTGHVARVVPMKSPKSPYGIGVQFDCYEVSRFPSPPVSMGAELSESAPTPTNR